MSDDSLSPDSQSPNSQSADKLSADKFSADKFSTETFTYRPGFGRGLTIAVGGLAAVSIVAVLVTDGLLPAIQSLPWLGLVAGGCWALFWRPEVQVDASGVRMVNVLRTITFPWPSIMTVDTKWALALGTRYGKYTAWAAPTSSRHSGKHISPGDAAGLPPETFGPGGTIRPGDSPLSPSGKVALVIRRRLAQLRDAGFLDNPQLEHERVPVVWHWWTIGAGLALLVLTLVTAFG